jgi:hypothetical protein
MLQVIGARLLASALETFLTEKFLINILLLVGKYIVNRTENDLDNQLFNQFKEALDNNHGTPSNLYKDLKDKIGN